MVNSAVVDVESSGVRGIVDPGDLRLHRVRKILRSEYGRPQIQSESLVDGCSVIAGDHREECVGIIDAQQLSKGVSREGNNLEGILLGACHARDEQQACRQGKPD